MKKFTVTFVKSDGFQRRQGYHGPKGLSDILHKVASRYFTCIESFEERGKRRAAITVFFEVMVNNKIFLNVNIVYLI